MPFKRTSLDIHLKLDRPTRDLLDSLASRSPLTMTQIITVALNQLNKNEAALSVIIPGYTPDSNGADL